MAGGPGMSAGRRLAARYGSLENSLMLRKRKSKPKTKGQPPDAYTFNTGQHDPAARPAPFSSPIL